MTPDLRKRCWLGTLCLLFVFGLLSACAPAPKAEPTGAAPAGKKELTIVTGVDVTSFDPHMNQGEVDNTVSFNIFDNLITRDADLKLIPALATEWKALNDTTWQLKLRQGVKFHNGEPFNAETVKFSIGRTIPSGDPKVFTRGYFTLIDRIEVVDEYTVNIATKSPDPLLLARLAFYGGQIIPRQYFQSAGAGGFNAKPIGTGPLKFVQWVKDDRTVLEANKEWWGGKIAFERVIFKPMPEAAPRVAALLKGEADIVLKLPPDDVDGVNRSRNAMAVGVPFAGLYVVATDYRRPWLDNKFFHQALSLAIDRQAILKDLWRGQGVIPNGIYPQGDWVYDPTLLPLQYDPAKAKQLLQQISYKGEDVIFETTAGYMSNDKQMAEALVAMWKEVGINVKLEVIEYSVRAQKNRDKNFKGLWWSDPTSTLLDPDGMVWRLTGPGTSSDYLRIPELDKLMTEARSSLDQAKRKTLYDQAHKIYLEYLQWIPIVQPIESYGIQRYIDWKPRPNGEILSREIKIK